MDAATKLVQAYLHINGYFTAAEYPLVDLEQGELPRIVTDIDMLAVRFGRDTKAIGKGKSDKNRERIQGPMAVHTDPALKCREDHTDMIVAEIKQGRVRVNPATRNPGAWEIINVIRVPEISAEGNHETILMARPMGIDTYQEAVMYARFCWGTQYWNYLLMKRRNRNELVEWQLVFYRSFTCVRWRSHVPWSWKSQKA